LLLLLSQGAAFRSALDAAEHKTRSLLSQKDPLLVQHDIVMSGNWQFSMDLLQIEHPEAAEYARKAFLTKAPSPEKHMLDHDFWKRLQVSSLGFTDLDAVRGPKTRDYSSTSTKKSSTTIRKTRL
jgi:hypothetical protein